MRVLGIVTARGGSKAIPQKNIRSMAGKPLLAWTAEAARASKLARTILSSDDDEIIDIGRQVGLEVPFKRPGELGKDTTPSIDVVLHAIGTLTQTDRDTFDAVMLLQPTSPLRTARHIDEAIQSLSNDTAANSLVSVVQAPHNMIPESLMRFDRKGYLEPVVQSDVTLYQRQLKPMYFARNGAAIYLVRRNALIASKSLFCPNILAYEMQKIDSIDIDDMVDWKVAELFLTERLKQS